MNLARNPIRGSRCKTHHLQPWVGLALCKGLLRSRHLHPITGSPGGVNRHAEPGGPFGARLWALIRCSHQPPTQLKLRECGSPRRLSQPERDFASLRLHSGRPEGASPRAGTRRGHGRVLSFREGGHVPDPGLDLAGRSCPWLVYPRRASGPTCRASPAISDDWFMRGPDHVPGHGSFVASTRGLEFPHHGPSVLNG